MRDPQGAYAPLGLLDTDPSADPSSVVAWFVLRGQVAVPGAEARRPVGGDTQRPGSAKAIARPTPRWLGRFAWITLLAHALSTAHPSTRPRHAAWYAKRFPAFSDALAFVPQCLWSADPAFRLSTEYPDLLKIPKPLFDPLISTLSDAA